MFFFPLFFVIVSLIYFVTYHFLFRGAGSGGVFGTGSDQDILQPTLVPYLSTYNINQVLTAATSRSVYGIIWFYFIFLFLVSLLVLFYFMFFIYIY
jgi:hypothetical protein